MKKKYVTPMFVAERYEFNDGIAACKYHVDPNTPIVITPDIQLCPVVDNGHKLGANNGTKGNIVKNNFEGSIKGNANAAVTLFNDGKARECEFDWAGPNNNVVWGYNKTSNTYSDFGDFAEAFYGNDANPEQHAPAYKGQEMFS